jgi:biopolymer transport protein TolQ
MPVTPDLSFLSLVNNASLLVQLVMALLLFVSVMSWTYIFRKMFAIRSARKQTDEFERIFWSGANLDILYEDATTARRQRTGKGGALERIFESGMSEYHKAKASFAGQSAVDTGALLDGARRISGRWTGSNRIWRFWHRSVRFPRMSACSAPYGAS